jgi:hypothetical protein
MPIKDLQEPPAASSLTAIEKAAISVGLPTIQTFQFSAASAYTSNDTWTDPASGLTLEWKRQGRSTGSITILNWELLVSGNTFGLNDGVNVSQIFEWAFTPEYELVNPGAVRIDATAVDSNASAAAAVKAAVNGVGATLAITAGDITDATVAFANDALGAYNTEITVGAAPGAITKENFSGGTVWNATPDMVTVDISEATDAQSVAVAHRAVYGAQEGAMFTAAVPVAGLTTFTAKITGPMMDLPFAGTGAGTATITQLGSNSLISGKADRGPDGKVPVPQLPVGVAGGVAALGGDGLVPAAQLPAATAIIPGIMAAADFTKLADLPFPVASATIGAGGAASATLACSASGLSRVSIDLQGAFGSGYKSYLEADDVDGTQERWVDDGSGTIKARRTSRAWLGHGTMPTINVGTFTAGFTPTTAGSVVVGGVRYGLLAGATSMQAFSMADPAAPAALGAPVTIEEGPVSMVVIGTIAVISCATTKKIQTIDCSDPAALVVLGTSEVSSSGGVVGKMAALNSTTVLVTMSNIAKVHAISIVDPASPTWLGTAATGTSTNFGVAVVGTNAFVASYTAEAVDAFDCSNPAAITKTSTLTMTGTGCSRIRAYSSTVVIVGGYTDSKVYPVDISDPSAMAVLGAGFTVVSNSGNVNSLVVMGSYVIATRFSGTGGLRTIDFSVPASPVELESGTAALATPPMDDGLCAAGDFLIRHSSTTVILDHIGMPVGGTVDLWRSSSGAWSYAATMTSLFGRAVVRSTGRLPDWSTNLKIISMDSTGLAAGGTIKVWGK